MAGNDWINSYLEAILDVGPGLDDAKSSLLLRERGRFSPTRYFVEEVITGFDETDLHRSWVKVRFICLFIYSYNNSMYFDMYISTHVFCRLKRRGVLKRGIRGWRTCVGGFGTWLVRKSRFPFFFLFSIFKF